MNLSRILTTFLLIAGLNLPGCGGGAGGLALTNGGGGIGGTGLTSTGTIDGFGSIFVNGVEFETDESEVKLDGVISTQDELRLGMVVTVQGTVNEDGKTGTADRVVFDDDVQGPVSAIEIGRDGDSLLLTVLGVEIIAERIGTVFDGVSFDTLLVGDLVKVSGFVENGTRLRATRIEKQSTNEVALEGTVSGLSGTTFTLNTLVVEFANADLSGVPGGSITEGMLVKVRGSLNGSNIVADRVVQEYETSDRFDDGDEVSLQGAISNLVDKGLFDVNGVAVDATSAALAPASLLLANGAIVEVEGRWNGSVLVAKEVTARRGRVKLEAKVASVNASQGNITLQFFTGTVIVQVDGTTVLYDDTNQADPLTLGDIASGNFLVVEAIKVGDSLVASRVRRDEQDDNILQAQVDSFSAGVDITLLGITFSTEGAEFENQSDGAVSADTFFGELRVGDLVKVKDQAVADGIADTVEFEREDALDGEEFDDDCDDTLGDSDSDCATDDDDDDDSDDDCTAGDAGSDDDCATDDEDDSDDDCTAGDAGSGDDCVTDDDDGSSTDDCDLTEAGSDDGCVTDGGEDSGEDDPDGGEDSAEDEPDDGDDSAEDDPDDGDD